MKKNIYDNIYTYFDMDGVLAVFQEDKSIEEVASRGYFSSLDPYWKMIDLVKRLIKAGFKVNILSAVFLDDHSRNDKINWLKKVDLFDKVDIIFVPYGDNKKDYVEQKGCRILFDDFTPNLKNWQEIPDFIGVKVFTDVNTKSGYGSWHGLSIDVENDIDLIETQVTGLLNQLALQYK